ncbi:MAG: hypothetical protein HY332_25885 [Chloroflexi bacterium]|nr:hypothetical protein [Chloroflexota bacterium]
MADEDRPVVWGLWNGTLGEWWNPGTRKPYFATRDEAHRVLPLVMRQYNFGHWEVREFPLDEEPVEQGPDEGRSEPPAPAA